jgi:hypothetical protein
MFKYTTLTNCPLEGAQSKGMFIKLKGDKDENNRQKE